MIRLLRPLPVSVAVGVILIGGCTKIPALSRSDAPAEHFASYYALPLYFVENRAQLDSKVAYYEKGSGHATYFATDGVYLALTNSARNIPQRVMVKVTPVGANTNRELIAEGKHEGRVNYFLGHDPAKWKTNVPTYQAVVYREIYPDIDLKFYGNNRQMEYDVIVKPGADPSAVTLAYEGIEGLRVTGEGDLEIQLKEGAILQKKPVAYQDIEGTRRMVAAHFTILSEQRAQPERFAYGFEVASYDTRHTLVIDPTMVYSTYLGGSFADAAHSIAVDAAGNTYVTGYAGSLDFPTSSPIQPSSGGPDDAFVVKLSSDGAMLYATYLGGSGQDAGYDIAVDTGGNAYVTGTTNSINFPRVSPLQSALAGETDVFVAKLNAAGTALVYSTYLGGSERDGGASIAVDAVSNVYVTGETMSGDFPLATPLQATLNGTIDAFVAKINAAGTGLGYSTYLGGSDLDSGTGIAVDTVGRAYVTGATHSGDFPTANPLQASFGGGLEDAFVAMFTAAGTAFTYSTYLGGSSSDSGAGIAVDSLGRAHVTGQTFSVDFPTVSPLQAASNGSPDVFVSRVDATGASLSYSTYLGGTQTDGGTGIALGAGGGMYVTGSTSSPDFPLASPIRNTFGGGGFDAFLFKLSVSGTTLDYSTFLGGSRDERGLAVSVDASDSAYVTGYTEWLDPILFPPLVRDDPFVTRITETPSVPSALAALSTRARVQTGDNVVIGGLYIGGTDPKTVLIRARGGSLGGPPFNNPGVLANPTMQLYSGSMVIAQNNDWQITDPLCTSPAAACGGEPEITATGMDPCRPNPGQTSAPPGCGLESALYVTLPPGGYTAVVRGENGTAGMGLVEVFEVGAGPSPLVAISTRARVETGTNVAIGGFWVGGGDPKTLLIRARGGSLGGPPFNNPGVLANPTVELYSGNVVIAQNDNWQTTDPLCAFPATSCGDVTQIAATGFDPCQPNPGQASAPPGCSLEAAVLITLPPGGYTAIVRGVAGGMGIGMVEVFESAP